MTHGKLILLSGTVCSGKTSIVNALQTVLDEPYLHVDIEQYLRMAQGHGENAVLWPPASTCRTQGEYDDSTTALAAQLVANMHQSIVALVCAGHNVIAEHLLLEASWLRACALQFCTLSAWFVGVRCPVAVTEQRAGRRGRHLQEQVRVQFERVHTHGIYDLEVDTSVSDPLECALQIQNRLQTQPAPLALAWLQAYTSPAKHRGWLRLGNCWS
jgi:chloramphenicol 3-O phosphotransferase